MGVSAPSLHRASTNSDIIELPAIHVYIHVHVPIGTHNTIFVHAQIFAYKLCTCYVHCVRIADFTHSQMPRGVFVCPLFFSYTLVYAEEIHHDIHVHICAYGIILALYRALLMHSMY